MYISSLFRQDDMVSAVSSTLPELTVLSGAALFGRKVVHLAQAVLTDIQKAYAAIFYATISLIAWVFSREAYLYCRSKAVVYCLQTHHLEDYLTHGDRLIHSSINFRPYCTQYDEGVSLEIIYGQTNTQRWLQNHNPLEPPSRERYSACCAGISFDFLSKYLAALQNGRPLSEAIELASSHREEGATIEAELAQILVERSFASVNIDEISRRVWGPIWNERQPFQELCDLYYAAFERESLSIGYIPIATMFGCRIQIPPNLQATPHHSIHSLEKSSYYLSLPSKIPGEPGHGIVYIKTEETDFLFDPNFGTIKLEPDETADYFRELYQDQFNLENLSALQVLSLG